jgi:hypothetical protein
MDETIKNMMRELLGEHASDEEPLSHEEYVALYDQVTAAVTPIIDTLSKEDYKDLYDRLHKFAINDSVETGGDGDTSLFAGTIKDIAFFMHTRRLGDVSNRYYQPYVREVLTKDGIVVTDGPHGEFIKTVPNDNDAVKLLREAIAIHESGDEAAFLAFCHDKKRWDKFSPEDRFMIKGSYFGDPKTCLDNILEDIQIREY